MIKNPRHLAGLRHLAGIIAVLALLLLSSGFAPAGSVAAPPSSYAASSYAASSGSFPNGALELEATVSSERVIVEAAENGQATAVLGMAEEGWTRLARDFPATPPGRVHIVVLDPDRYELVEPAPMTRGFATFGGNRIFLRGDQVDSEVVVHELAHIFLGHTARPGIRIPDWFNEGIAQYASGARPPTLSLVFEASAGNLLALPDLNHVDALTDDRRRLATMQGLAVVQFLVLEFGEAQLWELIENLSVARTFEHALLVTYGYSDLEINERWMAYADDTYSVFSPAALRILGSAAIGVLALIASAVFFLRRTVRLYGGSGPSLDRSEIEAAQLAEELLPEDDYE